MLEALTTPLAGTHLVVGAGPVGAAIATLLAAQGVEVVMASRSSSGSDLPGVRRAQADAANPESLLAACPNPTVIYNAVNPEYTRWPVDWPPMAQAFLQTAETSGAVLATVSNLYGYGPVETPMHEEMPFDATTKKAAVRVRMWQDALTAHEGGKIRYVEVRGSDYICPGTQSMLGDRVVPRILAGKSVQLLGDVDQPHTWTAPVDVARTIVLVASDPRGWGRAWHVPSNSPRTQREAVADIANAAGVPTPKVSSVSPVLRSMLGLVQPLLRELQETDYQRNRPYILDDRAARTTFGLKPTPWDEIITALVAAYR
jgi:nucleoside-diphosphate-sugar epimerase